MTMPFDQAILDDAIQTALAGGATTNRQPNQEVAPNPPEDDGSTPEEQRQQLLKALLGADCPLAMPEVPDANDSAWVDWVRSLWNARRPAVQLHLHLVERNRLFRSGQQWVSAQGLGPWREPSRPRESARVVYNMINKALDQRLQIILDQRPGFAVQPMTSDPDDKRRAQARQLACEYQFDQLNMDRHAREATYWAQTDGVAFWHLFWDPDRGPWDERLGERAGERLPLGDINIQTLRCEQVRVSPDATATRPPSWVLVREVIPTSEAAYRYGFTGIQAAEDEFSVGQMTSYAGSEGVASWVLSQTTVGEGNRLRNEDVTSRWTLYVAPQPEILPNGLQLTCVGNHVVFGPSDLLFGVIPIVPIRDGSSDPSYYPRPVMEQWIDHQMRINALLSKWVENIRVNAGGRFLARPNAIATETFLGGVTSMIEVRGAGSMGDSIQPVSGFSVGTDVKEALALEKQAFEDASGYNAISRGQITGESGRAIIASREQLERVFAPPVQALAESFTDWARICLAIMGWGYDVPRSLGAVGAGRPDLARAITGSDLDGDIDVRVEKATMMPMPMAFRLYMLDNWLQAGIIDVKEYRRRQMFAVARDIASPDEDQEARAKRVADAIKQGIAIPEIRWQDNEAIHQDVLEREILLQDDLPPQVLAQANERWIALANQAVQKQQGPIPTAPTGVGGGSPGQAGATASVPTIPPGQLPLASGNPPIGVAPLVQQTLAGSPDAEQVARLQESLIPQ